MRRILALISLLVVGVASAQDFDLPEVIAHLHAEESGFATDFCWIGDQNDDGFDDILVTHEGAHTAKLFFGSREGVENEPDFVFEPYLEHLDKYVNANYIGDLIPDRESFLALLSLERSNPLRILLDLQESGDELNDEPEYSIVRNYREGDIHLSDGYMTRPADTNGDGYNDLFAYERGDSLGRFLIYYGGEDFDTIPDWSKTLRIPWGTMGRTEYSGGFDMNSDGYDDMLIRTYLTDQNNHQNYNWYSLYLGGSPMDTMHVFTFQQDHFEGTHTNIKMQSGFSMLPDVNDDGFDDWGIFWTERTVVNERPYVDNGFRIFFGSEEPGINDYIDIEAHPNQWIDSGDLTGGDFNNDGFSDIATCLWSNFSKEVHVHFGPDWDDGDIDININLENEYGGIYYGICQVIGAVGDYNGDDVDDFVTHGGRSVVIFAGSEEWEVGIESNPQPEDYNLSIRTHPNPFNSMTNITYQLPKESHLDIALYDISGRQVITLFSGVRQAGKWSTTLNGSNLSSGIYFIKLNSGDLHMSQKVVLIK